MNDPASIFLACVVLILAFLSIRSRWKTIQVNRAIRQTLKDDLGSVLKVQRIAVFSDHGSIPAAFVASLCVRDYSIWCRAADGTEYVVNAKADFHPISAALRSIHLAENSDHSTSQAKPDTIREFLDAFEEVFDRDWIYTKQMFGIRDETEEQKAEAAKLGLESIPIIAADGTFADPKVEDEVEDWGNRGRLLQVYRILKKELS